MGNRRFRLSNIIPTHWLSRCKTTTTDSAVAQADNPQHREKVGQLTSNESVPIQSFDEMLLLSSSSRSFRTHMPLLTLDQPRRPSVYNPSNSDDSSRRHKVHSKCCHGVRLKVKSPRINVVKTSPRNASKSSSSCSSSGLGKGKRRALPESSVTVVKSSANPESDFQESMVEMIMENNIFDLDGLEELLVCYLVLNTDEFHEVIVSVFKEIVIALFDTPKKWTV